MTDNKLTDEEVERLQAAYAKWKSAEWHETHGTWAFFDGLMCKAWPRIYAQLRAQAQSLATIDTFKVGPLQEGLSRGGEAPVKPDHVEVHMEGLNLALGLPMRAGSILPC